MSEQIIDTLSQYSSVGSNYTDSDIKSSDVGAVSSQQKSKRVSQTGLDLSVEQKPSSNFKMSAEVEKNLQRFSSLQENCSSINVKNKLKELIEQQYTIQIQNLIEELNQTKLDKANLEKKLQIQVKNQIDYISEVRQSIGNSNITNSEGQSRNTQNISSSSSNNSNKQYQQVLDKLKSHETQQKVLEFQVQELTTELKMAKISQSQYKKQIQKLNETIENNKDSKNIENKNDSLKKIDELQKQLNEYKTKYENLQQQVKNQITQETQPDDTNDYQKTRQATESEITSKNNILFTDQSQSEHNNREYVDMSDVKYYTSRFKREQQKPINYLKNMNYKQLDQLLQRFQNQKLGIQSIYSHFNIQSSDTQNLNNKQSLNILQKQIEIEKFKKKVLDTDNNQLYNKLINIYSSQ